MLEFHFEYLLSLGYPAHVVSHLAARCRRLASAEDVQVLISGHDYFRLGSAEQHKLRALREAIADGTLTCLEASLLACDLAQMLRYECWLMIMTRVDPKTAALLGHSAMIYRDWKGAFGAIAKSRHPTQASRPCTYSCIDEVVLSYANAYIELGLMPVCFGVVQPETLTQITGWRTNRTAFVQLHEQLLGCQKCGFARND